MGNTYNRVYIWCCKYGENRLCERCANKKWCASKHWGLLNSCLGKLCLHPYLVVPLISARVTLISTRVSAHCQAILLSMISWNFHWLDDLIQNGQHDLTKFCEGHNAVIVQLSLIFSWHFIELPEFLWFKIPFEWYYKLIRFSFPSLSGSLTAVLLWRWPSHCSTSHSFWHQRISPTQIWMNFLEWRTCRISWKWTLPATMPLWRGYRNRYRKKMSRTSK